MKNISGDSIYIISRHSNWSTAGVEKAFAEAEIQPPKNGWKRLIEIALIILGIGFLVAGIIFFFAYNWHYLHRFVKLSIVQSLVLIVVLLAVFTHWPLWVKNSLLTGASLLAGCLFAVFGQVYQTGADAYDFFLGWTIFIVLWCVAARFIPLWLLLLFLVNITISLYYQQVASRWNYGVVTAVLFAINTIAVIVAEWSSAGRESLGKWFIRIATLAALACSTAGICEGIFDNYSIDGSLGLWLNVVMALVLYPLAILRSLKMKHFFYLTVVPLSTIIILSACIFRMLDNSDEAAILLTGVFIAISVMLVIRQIITLNKTWHEQQLTHR